VVLENHHYGYHHTRHSTVPCVQLDRKDNEQEYSSDYGWHKIPAHLR
jgi:hypothetical protein